MKVRPNTIWFVWLSATAVAAIACYLLALSPKIEFPILLAAMAGPLYPLFDSSRKALHEHTRNAHPAAWAESEDGLDPVKLHEFYKSPVAQSDAKLVELRANTRQVGIITAVLGLSSPWVAGLLALALR